MPTNKELEEIISLKLDQLSKLIDKIDEAHVIDSDDPDTWDSDALYDLVETLKETLKLLEDKEHPQEKDKFGQPLILETGLLSLMDEYQFQEEESQKEI